MPRPSLLTIWKLFIRPHLDFGEVIYDQAFNNSFHCETERIQYNAELSVAIALRDTPKENLYQELGFESYKQIKLIV